MRSLNPLDNIVGMLLYTYPMDLESMDIYIPRPEGFLVVEIPSREFLVNTMFTKSHIHEARDYLALIRKTKISTIKVAEKLRKLYGCRYAQYLGLKETRGTTYQFILLKNCDCVPNIMLKHRLLEAIITPLTHGKYIHLVPEHYGNAFLLTVCTQDRIDILQQRIAIIEKYRILLNYYGYQRFGTHRPITHLVGRHIIQRNFIEALASILMHGIISESNKSFKLRLNAELHGVDINLCREFGKAHLDIEYTACKEIIKHGALNDEVAKNILKKIKPYIKLFVNAYQSYLFNLTISILWNAMLESLGFESILDFKYLFLKNIVPIIGLKFDKIMKIVQNTTPNPISRLIGYAVDEVLRREELKLDLFMVPELGLRFYGSLRSLLCVPSIHRYFDIGCHVEGYGECMFIELFMPRGSYVTVFLREITRSNPLLWT